MSPYIWLFPATDIARGMQISFFQMRGDFMRTSFKLLLLSSVIIAVAAPVLAQTTPPLQYAKQGWTEDERQAFYTTSQGSHMMPYAWYKALRRLDKDEPFGADQLQRY